ncbi:hypothetical protein [Aquimarina sp. BL5]|uniref:hypothetical protein n=1 Tax=Aquimarina sp. BL5 TaxID=1714860 RepID=UPI000EA8DF98|nr:hypothetical protein [Aquimarina sp. BL5]
MKNLIMKGVILGIFLISIAYTAQSQDAVIDINFEEETKRVLYQYKITESGDVIALHGIRTLSKDKQDARIVRFSNNFDTIFNNTIESNAFSKLIVSSDANYFLYHRNVYDRTGKKYKPYDFKREFETGNVDPFINFFASKYDVSIGNNKNEKKGFKDKFITSQFYMFTRDNETLEDNEVKLNFPDLPYTEEVMLVEYKKHTDDRFYLAYKDLSEDKKRDRYNILAFNYDGTLTYDKSLELTLDNNMFFNSSNNGSGGFLGAGNFIDNLRYPKETIQQATAGNVYIDTDNEAFYMYGLYSDKDNFYHNRPKGFFLFKYDFDGNLIWKVQKDVENKEFMDSRKGIDLKIDLFNMITDIGVGINIDGMLFTFKIDPENGTIGDSIIEYYYRKQKQDYNKKLMLSSDTQFAMLFNDKVKEYLDAKKGIKRKEIITAKVIDGKGFYLIEKEDHFRRGREKVKIVKFDF